MKKIKKLFKRNNRVFGWFTKNDIKCNPIYQGKLVLSNDAMFAYRAHSWKIQIMLFQAINFMGEMVFPSNKTIETNTSKPVLSLRAQNCLFPYEILCMPWMDIFELKLNLFYRLVNIFN